MSTPALNPLVEKVRAKYPGAYDDMDDATLTKKLLAKYPQYSDLAAPPTSSMPGAPSQQPMASPGVADRFATAAGAATANMIPTKESLSHMMNDKPAAGEGDSSILPESVNNAAKGTLRSTFSEPYARAASGDIAGAAGQFLPNALALGATARSVAKGLARTPAPEPVYPGAALPETPARELLQGNALTKGPQTYVDPAAGLERPVRAQLPEAFNPPQKPLRGPVGSADNPFQKPEPPAPTRESPPLPDAFNPPAKKAPPVPGTADLPFRDVSPRAVEQAVEDLGPKAAPVDIKQRATEIQQRINDALGGKELQKDAPLGSSAVKRSEYDPAKQELHIQPVGGRTTYVYGDVSADQAAEFAAHPSKGTAWLNVKRSSSPLVAKIIDGKRIAVRPVPKAPTEDLTQLLQQSVEQARAAKGAAAND